MLPISLYRSERILQSGFLSPSLRASVTWLTKGSNDFYAMYWTNRWTLVSKRPFSRYHFNRGVPNRIPSAKKLPIN